jgi:hypothetical protein
MLGRLDTTVIPDASTVVLPAGGSDDDLSELEHAANTTTMTTPMTTMRAPGPPYLRTFTKLRRTRGLEHPPHRLGDDTMRQPKAATLTIGIDGGFAPSDP